MVRCDLTPIYLRVSKLSIQSWQASAIYYSVCGWVLVDTVRIYDVAEEPRPVVIRPPAVGHQTLSGRFAHGMP